MKLGVFGGTFDPIHIGHLIVAEAAMEQLGLDRVLFVPAGKPWLKAERPISDSSHRLAMVKLAVRDNPCFMVTDMEIIRPGPSYTVDTIDALIKEYGSSNEYYVVLGLDALSGLASWHEPARLLELAWLVGVTRPGATSYDSAAVNAIRPGASKRVFLIEGPSISISGTEIRRRVAAGLSIKYRVPEEVDAYIRTHGLYGVKDMSPEETSCVRTLKERILGIAIERGALMFGEFKLASGRTSSYYFDGRILTLDPEGAYCIARAFLPVLYSCEAEFIAGPTLGADPIVAAVAALSFAEGKPIPGLIVRKEAKEHGTKRSIEGPLRPGAKVAVVDDTCTTGGSLFHAIEAVEAAGCKVVKAMTVLDRREGGSDEIVKRGYDFCSLLRAKDGKDIVPVS